MQLRGFEVSSGYDAENEQRFRRVVERLFARCFKHQEDVVIDARNGSRVILTSPNGTRWVMGVSDTGATTWTPL
jgi:hypothetical protein